MRMKRTWPIWVSLIFPLLVTSCKTQLHPNVNTVKYYQVDSAIIGDTSIINYYTPFKEKLEQEMNRVVGISDISLEKSRDAESLAGNFFVDALLWKGKQLDPQVNVSFATKGGIRSGLPKGNITIGNLFEMMPFENAVTIITLSGKDMIRWAEYMAKTGGQPAAGIKLIIHGDQVDTFEVNGNPVDPSATYKMVTYDYLANGGDYINFLDTVLERKDYTQRVREALIEYVSLLTTQGNHIQTKLDGRVTIRK